MILGAGMAGLAAAVELLAGGVEAAVIEARDRVGGRVWSAREAGDPLPVELGAELVHGEAPEVVRLARAAGAPLLAWEPSHWRRRAGRLEEMPGWGASVARGLARAGAVARRGPDRSFAAALSRARVRDPARARALAYVEGFHASHVERISARALAAEDPASERVRRVLPGFDALARHLRGRLPPGSLHLGTEVLEVRWEPGRVELACRATSGRRLAWRASRALVTAPPSTFAPDGAEGTGLRFAPPLREKRAPLARLAMGRVVKLGLVFDEPFWLDPARVRARKGADPGAMAFLLAPGEAFPTWWTSAPLDAPVLTAWAGGPRAEALEALEQGSALERALEVLARLLGMRVGALQARLRAVRSHDWTADPFARGAYSYPLVGGSDAARKLAAPLSDTLYFAGEATCPPPDHGTVQATLRTGVRAARQILAARAP